MTSKHDEWVKECGLVLQGDGMISFKSALYCDEPEYISFYDIRGYLAKLDAENEWRKGAHIEGVIDKHNTLGAILEQCQESNGKLKAENEQLREALEAARMFIVNGVELGYIRMPDKDTPDPAHDTLPMIEQALEKDT
jgi:hypothetical protein